MLENLAKKCYSQLKVRPAITGMRLNDSFGHLRSMKLYQKTGLILKRMTWGRLLFDLQNAMLITYQNLPIAHCYCIFINRFLQCPLRIFVASAVTQTLEDFVLTLPIIADLKEFFGFLTLFGLGGSDRDLRTGD